MALDRRQRREKRWKGTSRLDEGDRPSRSVVVALLLGCATLITLDHQGGDDSLVEPARRVVGEAFGPVEEVTAAAVRPFSSVPSYLRSKGSLADDNEALERENAALRAEVRTSDYDRNRLREYDELTRTAARLDHTLLPARVIGHGSAQSFSQTITIDAGTDAGVHTDMAVVNSDGLVGRVVRATRTTATVVLILDPASVVGGRLGHSMEVGFLRGRGNLSGTGRLDLALVDGTVIANEGDTVVTWGSEDGAPYVAGIPIGRVAAIFSSPRETSRRAVIEPFVDFTSLDLVGVVVPAGTEADRGLIRAEGEDR